MTDLIFALRRRWPVVVAGLLLGAVIGAVTASGGATANTTEWQGREIVFLNLRQGTTIAVVSVSQAAEQVTRGAIRDRAAEILEFEGEPSILAQSVTAEPLVDSLAIEISATAASAQRAVDVASAFATAFLEVTNAADNAERQAKFDTAQQRRDAAQGELNAFDEVYPEVKTPTSSTNQALVQQRIELDRQFRETIAELTEAQAALDRPSLYFTQGAEQPQFKPSQVLAFPKSRPIRAAIVALLGLTFSVVLMFILERISPRIDTKEEVIDILGVPVIGEIGVLPRRHRQGKHREPVSLDLPSAEAYRRVRSTFQFVLQRRAENGETAGNPSAVFMIISPSPAEGKSTTVAMTALSMAEAGEPTLVLGCDYRRPVIDILLGIPRGVGITARAEMSIDRPELREIVHPGGPDNLWVAPAGKPTRSIVGCAEVARELIQNARESGLSVVVDTTPVLVANDALELLESVDEIVMVIRAGQTTVKSAQAAIDLIRQHGRSVLGIVLVASPSLSRIESYYADYYYEPEDSAPASPDPGPTNQTPNQPAMPVPYSAEVRSQPAGAGSPHAARIDGASVARGPAV